MKHSTRKWHTWLGIALGTPLLLVGLTTFFIAHEKSLGTKDILLPFGSAKGNHAPDIRSSLAVGAEEWIGTSRGVFRLTGDGAVPLDGAPRDEIRGMVQTSDGVIMAGKKAIWRYANGQSEAVYKADCWQVAASRVGYSAACKETGLLISTNGRQWAERDVRFEHASSAAAATGTPLSKIIMDIHTGKIFFGKRYEWIWIDLLGLACVVLGITGFVMWFKVQRAKKLQARKRRIHESTQHAA